MIKLILGFVLVTLSSVAHAQDLPAELQSLHSADVSQPFTRIQDYNRLISKANTHHYNVSKERVKLVLGVSVGAFLLYTGVPVIAEVISEDADGDFGTREVVGVASGVIGLGLISASSEPYWGAKEHKRAEQEAISQARQLFPSLQPRR